MESWQALKAGGPTLYPLFFLALIATTIMIDRLWLIWRHVGLQTPLEKVLLLPSFTWEQLAHATGSDATNYYAQFGQTFVEHRHRPLWWIESRAQERAQELEKSLGRGLWLLETIVTAAPLLGLLGTITGMMHAFHLIGSNGLVDPGGITGGVAQALIATAVGIFIALIALFGFNYCSRQQTRMMEDMERIGTLLLDRIRLDHEGNDSP